MRPKLPTAELERRRHLAVERINEGYTVQEVAEFLDVHVRSVFRWVAAFRARGCLGLKAVRHPGPAPKLSRRQQDQVCRWLRRPASHYGFSTELWTAKRLATLIHQRLGVSFNPRYLCLWLHKHGFSPQKPRRVPRERNDEEIARWLREDWPQLRREAMQTKAHLVWIDESGYLLAPLLRRTWGLRGKTPVLRQRARHRDKVSAIAAFTLSPSGRRRGLYFETYPKAYINNVKVAAFLRQLLRHLRRPVIVVWDGGNMHKGDPIRQMLSDFPRLRVERLPAYAPELNPVEHLWGYTKYGHMANYAPYDIDELHEVVLNHLHNVQRDPQRMASCFAASEIETSTNPAEPQLTLAV
jgi:transposase